MTAIEEIMNQAAEASQGGKRAVEQVGDLLQHIPSWHMQSSRLLVNFGLSRCRSFFVLCFVSYLEILFSPDGFSNLLSVVKGTFEL